MLMIAILSGIVSGFCIKQIINWLCIDGYTIKKLNLFPELVCLISWVWAFKNLPTLESVTFALIIALLVGISMVDYHTMQIPLIFIMAGLAIIFGSIVMKIFPITPALWGIFVGAGIPLIIMISLWFITKRQGMGFGDIQLGIILGAWLGPMRMAITLFSASLMSLFVWICVSLIYGFDKDRAIPMGPFLSVAGGGTFIGSFYYPELFHLLII